MVLFEYCVRRPQPPLLKIENLAKNRLKIISSETTGPIGPKLGWNGLQVVIFQNCVCRPRLPSKMATITKNRNSAKNHLKIISSETAGSIGPKLWWNGLQVIPFQNSVRRHGHQPRCPPLLKIENLAKNHLKMISETAGSNGPKLW